MNWLKKNIAFLVVALILLILPFIIGFPSQIISWDAFGYYLYLPQTFIEGDPALSDLTAVTQAMETYKMTSTLYQIHPVENGNHVIQYTCGLSLLYSIFFFFAHIAALIFGYAADGYSAPYQWGMIIGSYTYMLIGLYYANKSLLQIFSKKIAFWSLVLMALGTNYLVIHSLSHGMPHVYLFTLYSLLIWNTIRWHQHHYLKNALGIGISLGLMTLARPTELIAVLIPIFYGVYSWTTFKTKVTELFGKHLKHTLIIFFTVFLIGSIQLLYWKFTTGHFFYNSYANPGEGLEVLHPHLFEFLFSYRKGWFLYTPLALFAIIGIFAFKGEQKQNWRWPLLIFIFLNIYISASWSTWWYAGSFGQRTMVQSYLVIGIGFGALLTYLSTFRLLKYVTLITVFLLFLVNIFQSWQYKVGILPMDRITQQYYWSVFGKTTKPDNVDQLLLIDRENAEFNPNKVTYTKSVITGSEESVQDGEWGETIAMPYNEITSKSYAWIVSEIWLQYDTLINYNELYLVNTFIHKGGNYRYLTNPIVPKQELKQDDWFMFNQYYLTPEIRLKTDEFKTYVWNPKIQKFKYKNLKIDIFEPLNEE